MDPIFKFRNLNLRCIFLVLVKFLEPGVKNSLRFKPDNFMDTRTGYKVFGKLYGFSKISNMI
jgi:hypothetical protein